MITAAHCPNPEDNPDMNIKVMVGHLDKKDLIYKRKAHLIRNIVGIAKHPRFGPVKALIEWPNGTIVMKKEQQNVGGTIIQHETPAYGEIFPVWDIMLVEFEPITFSRDIQPAMLPGLDCTTRKIKHDQKKTKLLFAGWGETHRANWPMARRDRPHWNLSEGTLRKLNSTPRYTSNWLQIMQAEILSLDQCRATDTYRDLWRGIYGKGRETHWGLEDNDYLLYEEDDFTPFDLRGIIENTWLCAKGVLDWDKMPSDLPIARQIMLEEPITCYGDSGCK